MNTRNTSKSYGNKRKTHKPQAHGSTHEGKRLLIETADAKDTESILQQTEYKSEAKLYNDFEILPLTETLNHPRVLFESPFPQSHSRRQNRARSLRTNIRNGSCRIGGILNPECQNLKLKHSSYQNSSANTQLAGASRYLHRHKELRKHPHLRKSRLQSVQNIIRFSNKLSLICFEKVKPK